MVNDDFENAIAISTLESMQRQTLLVGLEIRYVFRVVGLMLRRRKAVFGLLAATFAIDF
tara:strand:+ start:150 stop:326 length:177 start_codon:yes stop_codon:yes gene_type:complete